MFVPEQQDFIALSASNFKLSLARIAAFISSLNCIIPMKISLRYRVKRGY